MQELFLLFPIFIYTYLKNISSYFIYVYICKYQKKYYQLFMGENKEEHDIKKTNIIPAKDFVSIGSSIVGSIVGLAIGGPVGAVIGATTTPSLVVVYNFANRFIERKYEKTKKIAEKSLVIANIQPEEALEKLNLNDDLADSYINLLRIASEADANIADVMSSVLAACLTASSNKERERLLILSDSLDKMRKTHILILKALYEAGGVLKAKEIAKVIDIPEIELRSVVRDLELRGMIKDRDVHPTEWKLRELGKVIIEFANNNIIES